MIKLLNSSLRSWIAFDSHCVRSRRFPWFVFVGLITWIACGQACWSQSTLRLTDGDIFQGYFSAQSSDRIAEKDRGEFLIWQCNAFLEPMLIPWKVVDSISQNQTSDAVAVFEGKPHYVIELVNGESVSGRIEGINAQRVQLSSDRYTPVEIELDRVRAILKVQPASVEGVGRLSVNEWKQVLPVKRKDVPDVWVSKAGSIETAIAGSSIAQTASLPLLAVIDIDVAWTHSQPNWTLTVGNNLPKLELRVRKLEQRDELSITLLFEEESVADITTAMISSAGVESLRLKVLCDLEQGRFVLQQNGRAIGEISSQSKVKTSQSKLENRVRFQMTNDAPGGLILRELKVTRSPFSMTRSASVEGNQGNVIGNAPAGRMAKVLLTTGASHVGGIVATQNQTSDLLLNTMNGESIPFSVNDIDRVEYVMNGAEGQGDTSQPSGSTEASEYCVLQTKQGERFAGQSLQHSVDRLTLSCQSLSSPIRFSIDDISSVQFITNHDTAEGKNDQPIPMKLVCDEAHSNGKLVQADHATQESHGSGWAWRPASLSNEFVINPAMNGTIDVMRGSADSEPVDAASRNLSLRTELYGRSLDSGEPSLYLTTGDSLPGKLVRLDDGMLTFTSGLFGECVLASTHVKGVRQLVYTGTDRLDPILLKRLLTVPRMARQAPPAHLVVSRDGDMIRGNVTYIDEDLLRIEVRDEERELWMKNVAEVIWLDPPPKDVSEDSPASDKPETNAVDPAQENVARSEVIEQGASCQLVMRKGCVVSVIPSKIEAGLLSGSHPLLGICNIPIDDTVQILFGNEMEKSRSASRFAKWKLRHAIDPKFVTEEAEAASGEASDLVGKPALDFELKSLDGKLVKLSAMRGRVVVLDFWASWCGPCRKSLPVIQRVADDFGNEPFSFYAINVDEEPNVVQGSAIVLGIANNCLLDPKGTISKAYGANAIPYTVVIDREGIVRRVFVGANDEAFGALREAISQYLEVDSQ